MPTRRSGFTLPEILVTITAVAVLAAAVVPAVTQYVNEAGAPVSQPDLRQMQNAVSQLHGRRAPLSRRPPAARIANRLDHWSG